MSSSLSPAASAAKQRLKWSQPALGASTSGDPEVLFTFDDGPVPESTYAILDTLRAHHVNAVFFMVGHRLQKPEAREIVQRVLDDGNAVGNHSMGHLHLCVRANSTRISSEIDETAKLLEELSGMPAIFFRTPYGSRCHRLEEALFARGLTHMHWDVDPQEWKFPDGHRTQVVITKAIGRLRDGERAVILSHDTHAATALALPGVLDWIDAENARRRAAGRRPIRILAPSDIAMEQLAPGVSSFFAETPSGELIPDLARLFLAPLTARPL